MFLTWTPSALAARRMGLMATAIFCASLLAHVLTFLPSPPFLGWAWPLHVATFVPFGAMIFALPTRLSLSARKEGEGWLAWNARRQLDSQAAYIRLVALVPPMVTVLAGMLTAYVFVAFFANLGLMATPDEAAQDQIGIRLFSGHWMIFSMMPAIYFMFVEPRARAEEAEDDASPTD
ncbi:hypothetical protein ABI59_11115 [Acidobacteria bacterium Mor1]|nr:hypothetical protein ABI59_11115 [Acidobacteria bacterium Mor1]